MKLVKAAGANPAHVHDNASHVTFPLPDFATGPETLTRDEYLAATRSKS
jgi:hypothetical protein